MPNGLAELLEVEQLLRRAEARLGSQGTFRQRTLLQMTLFELRRSLDAQKKGDGLPLPVNPANDAAKK